MTIIKCSTTISFVIEAWDVKTFITTLLFLTFLAKGAGPFT